MGAAALRLVLLLLSAVLLPVAFAIEGMGTYDDGDADRDADPCVCKDRAGWTSPAGLSCGSYRRVDADARVWVNATRCREDGATVACKRSCGLCASGCDGGDDDSTYVKKPLNMMLVFVGAPCVVIACVAAAVKSCWDRRHDSRMTVKQAEKLKKIGV